MFDAEELQELQKKEKEMKVQPDWEIDAFTKAQARTGKRHSIVTDLILKLLGLDVSPSHPFSMLPGLSLFHHLFHHCYSLFRYCFVTILSMFCYPHTVPA